MWTTRNLVQAVITTVVGAFAIVGVAVSASLAQEQITSEEKGPINCRTGHLITDVYCDGRYCDNIGITCSPQPLDLGAIEYQYWTPQSVSEERGGFMSCSGPNHEQNNTTMFLTGFKCQGRYCDNLQLQCTRYQKMVGSSPNAIVGTNCRKTKYFSEEQRHMRFADYGPGYYPIAIHCRGSYCDDKAFEICQIKRVPIVKRGPGEDEGRIR